MLNKNIHTHLPSWSTIRQAVYTTFLHGVLLGRHVYHLPSWSTVRQAVYTTYLHGVLHEVALVRPLHVGRAGRLDLVLQGVTQGRWVEGDSAIVTLWQCGSGSTWKIASATTAKMALSTVMNA
jgi:hypothetical protein